MEGDGGRGGGRGLRQGIVLFELFVMFVLLVLFGSRRAAVEGGGGGGGGGRSREVARAEGSGGWQEVSNGDMSGGAGGAGGAAERAERADGGEQGNVSSTSPIYLTHEN